MARYSWSVENSRKSWADYNELRITREGVRLSQYEELHLWELTVESTREELQGGLDHTIRKIQAVRDALASGDKDTHYTHSSYIGRGEDGKNEYRFFSTEKDPFNSKSFKSILTKYADRFGPKSTLVRDSSSGKWLDVAGDVAAVTNSPLLRNITKTSATNYVVRLEEDLDRVGASDEERKKWKEAMRGEFLLACEHMNIYSQYAAWSHILFYLEQAQNSIKEDMENLKALKLKEI